MDALAFLIGPLAVIIFMPVMIWGAIRAERLDREDYERSQHDAK